MSYSGHRRASLEEGRDLAQRASHARSCAMLVAQKHHVPRSAVIEAVRRTCGVDLDHIADAGDLAAALVVIDQLRLHGLP